MLDWFLNTPLILITFKTYWYTSLREKCPYSEFFWPAFSRVSLRIQSECGKIRTRNLRIRTLFTQYFFVFSHNIFLNLILDINDTHHRYFSFFTIMFQGNSSSDILHACMNGKRQSEIGNKLLTAFSGHWYVQQTIKCTHELKSYTGHGSKFTIKIPRWRHRCVLHTEFSKKDSFY